MVLPQIAKAMAFSRKCKDSGLTLGELYVHQTPMGTLHPPSYNRDIMKIMVKVHNTDIT